MAGPRLRARLLGGFELSVDGQAVPASAFERPSGLRLLKLLVATPGHRLRREAAAELLWPDAEPERSGANLRKAIHFARRALATADTAAEAILAGDGPELRLEGELDVDADDLAAAIAAVERGAGRAPSPAILDDLVRLGGHELLPGDPYEDWLAPIRERLRERSIEALIAGAAAAQASPDRARAFALLERVLTLEPADERAHRTAIQLHLEAGELHAARRQLQACRKAVAEAYGVEPAPELVSLVERAAAERQLAEAEPAEPPIVGRRRELEAAARAFDAVASASAIGVAAPAAFVLLRGPAGIGKSRVLRELSAVARAAGWPTLELRGLEDATPSPLAPVGQAIVAAFGGRLPPTVSEPERSAVLVADPASAAEATVAFGSDEPIRRALLAVLAHVGEPDRPLAVVVDDAQWLDRASLELVEAVIGGGAPRPCLVLATVRDEPALVAGPVSVVLAAVDRTGGEEIALGPLAPVEIRAFIERDVAESPLEEGLAASLAELSAGAPLFAADLFRSASESRLIEARDGRWQFRRGVTALQVPEGIARLVERRISRMGPVARLVLAVAAELGDVVAFDDLVATGSSPDEVLDAADAALAAGLVVEREGRYAFAHPLYRAALRRGLPPRDRSSVHRRIAAMLSRGIDPRDRAAVRSAGERGVDLLAIAGHAASATELGSRETGALAVGFGIGAGERQAYLFDFAGAVATLRRALAIWQRLADAERDGFPISEAWVELGQALRRTGDDTGASAAFEAAMGAARDGDELATAASAAAWLPYEHGRFEPALAILDRVAPRIVDPIPSARLDSARGWIQGRNGDWSGAREVLARACRVLEAGGPTPDLMRALDRLGIAYRDGQPSDPRAAIPVLERAIHMAVELGRTGERAGYEMHLAGALSSLGRRDEAIAALDRARGLARLTGEQYIESVIEWIAAEVEMSRGHLDRAIEHRRRELEIFAAIGGNPRHEALAHAHIAHLARRLGDVAVEREESETARYGARHSGIDGLEARVDWALTTDDWFADMPAPAPSSQAPSA